MFNHVVPIEQFLRTKGVDGTTAQSVARQIDRKLVTQQRPTPEEVALVDAFLASPNTRRMGSGMEMNAWLEAAQAGMMDSGSDTRNVKLANGSPALIRELADAAAAQASGAEIKKFSKKILK